jgi:hypothetical protein
VAGFFEGEIEQPGETGFIVNNQQAFLVHGGN